MTAVEAGQLVGLLFACLAAGWGCGFIVYGVKRFFEQV